MNDNEKLLVTFALFAYNQEDYIREAIEGAFSQTYEPLEIILSDDCSTDRTYEIIEEMAAKYDGPHEVKVRKSEINFGTALHVSCVANKMKGELLIVAAGDDVSKEIRAERIVQEWVKNGKESVSAVHSSLEIRYNNKEKKIAKLKQTRNTKIDITWFLKNKYNPMYGPTCAYSRSVFDKYRPLLGGSLIEDAPLLIRAFMSGEVVAIDEPLVVQNYVYKSAGRNHDVRDVVRWNTFNHSKLTQRVNALIDLTYDESLSSLQKKSIENMFEKEIKKLACLYLPSLSSSGFFSKAILALRIFIKTPRKHHFFSIISSVKAVYGDVVIIERIKVILKCFFNTKR